MAATVAEQRNLIFSGVDTIETLSYTKYFDFVSGKSPLDKEELDSQDYRAHLHFKYDMAKDKYGLFLYQEGSETTSYPLYKDCGKVSLDSITTVDDSAMTQYGIDNGVLLRYNIFVLPPDSLLSLLGQCYVIKTFDPRTDTGWLYAKMKILEMNLQDTSIQTVNMRFLWACDAYGTPDLLTTKLDTFNLDSVSTLQTNHNLTSIVPSAGVIKKVINNNIAISNDNIESIEVYSINGKLLCKKKVTSTTKVDLSDLNLSEEMKIVKYKH